MTDGDRLTWQAVDRAGNLLRLAATGSSWILRRTDHLSFVGEASVTASTVLDVDLDGRSLERVPVVSGHRVLPLAVMVRGVDADVRVSDGEGVEILTLPKHRERALVAMGILSLANQADPTIRADAPDPTEAVRRILDAIEQPGGTESATDVEGEAIASWRQRYLVLALVPDRMAGDGITARFRLDRYQADHPRDRVGAEALVEQLDAHRRDFRWFRRIGDVQQSASYHFSLEAPPGTCVVDAWLEVPVVVHDPAARSYEPVPPVVRERDHDPTRVSLYWDQASFEARLDPHVEVFSLGRPAVAIAMRPSPGGVLRSAAVASWTSVVALTLLFVVSLMLGAPQAPGDAPFDTNSVVTVLLLGPTLLIGYTAVQVGHSLASDVYAGVRRWLLGCASATGAAALLFAIEPAVLVLKVGLGLLTLFAIAFLCNLEATRHRGRTLFSSDRLRSCAWHRSGSCPLGSAWCE